MKRKRIKSRNNQYVLISERDDDVQQWSFSRGKLFTLVCISVVLVATALFLSADALTHFLYKTKLKDLRENYNHLSTTLVALQNQLEDVSTQVVTIEEKDKAIRTYAGFPQVDQDVRKVGVGGMRIVSTTEMDNLVPDVKARISELEMNVGELSRRVKLELSSYNNMVGRVKDRVNNLRLVPSIRPVNGGYLGSGFGYRKDPFTGKVRFHYGQDFAVNIGTPVYTPADGIVRYAATQAGFGKVVKIDHGNGYLTIFAHLSSIAVKRGQKINRGELLGRSGNTGRSAGPHLHYEVHRYGAPQNPVDYFFSGYLK